MWATNKKKKKTWLPQKYMQQQALDAKKQFKWIKKKIKKYSGSKFPLASY